MFLLVVCLYGVVYGRLMDAKTWPLFGLYILRFIHYKKVFIPALNIEIIYIHLRQITANLRQLGAFIDNFPFSASSRSLSSIIYV